MRQRLFVALGCVLLSAASMFAQSGEAGRDSLTGKWEGEFVPPNASSGIPVTMVLKFDGKSAVTGTLTGLPEPGGVKSGTFDPKTGALKLQLGKDGDSAVLLVLEGTVANGKATGHVKGDDGIGDFTLAKKE
jgi:hypothetical protein